MRIHLLGTGTSQGVPVIGCKCPACLSNNPKDKRLRVAALLQIGAVNLVIDVGPDFRQQILRTGINHLDAVLLTHQHNDHIIGLDDVRPFNFRSGKDMPVYATAPVHRDVKKRFEYIFEENPYPGAPRLVLHEIHKSTSFVVNNIEIIPIEVWHGRLPVMGYRIGSFTYITDIKTIRPEELKKVEATEVLVISALHHQEHHSHLNLSQALAFIAKINPQKAYLTHISHRMGPTDEVEPRLPSNVHLAFDNQVIELNPPPLLQKV